MGEASASPAKKDHSAAVTVLSRKDVVGDDDKDEEAALAVTLWMLGLFVPWATVVPGRWLNLRNDPNPILL